MNWKPIKNYEGIYEVSDSGEVRSLDRTVSGKTINTRQNIKGRVLKKYPQVNGYLKVCLCSPGGRRWTSVHRLVAQEFIRKEREEHTTVHHLDNNKQNNRVENLKWVTHKENMEVANKDSRFPKGVHCYNSQINDATSVMIRLCTSIFSVKECSEIFKVSEAVVRPIKNGKTWKHTI